MAPCNHVHGPECPVDHEGHCDCLWCPLVCTDPVHGNVIEDFNPNPAGPGG